MKSRFFHYLVALTAFVMLALYSAYPAWIHSDRVSTNGGEEYLIAYLISWSSYIVQTDISRLFEVPFMHPTENTLAFSDYFISQGIMGIPLSFLSLSPLASHNLLVVLALILNPLSVYLVGYQLTKHRLASLLGAVVFGYSVGRFDALGHLQVFSMYWVGFGLWAWLRYLETNKRSDAVLVALFLVAQGLDSVFMTLVLLASLVVVSGVMLATKKLTWRSLVRPGIPLILGLTFLTAAYMPYFKVVNTYQYTRSIQDAFGGSAYWADYLYPTHNSRLRPFLDRHIAKNPWPAYMGLAATVLVGVSLFYFRKKKKDWRVMSALALFGSGVVLSLGPFLQIIRHQPVMGLSIPLPYWVLYHVVPGFQGLRVPQRWSHLAILGACLLISLWAGAVLKKIKRKRWQVLLVGLVGVMVIGELRLPVFTRTVPDTNLVYETLALEPAGVVLALPASTYPFQLTHVEIDRLYHFAPLFGREHRYVNGYSGFADPGWAQRIYNLQIDEHTFLTSLTYFDADYVIVNGEQWDEMSDSIGSVFYIDQLIEMLESAGYTLMLEDSGERLFFKT